MAREWEESHVETFDERVTWYRRHNRRTEALRERRFNPADLTEQDLRSGDTRRFIQDDGHGDLDSVLITKNTFEGLTD